MLWHMGIYKPLLNIYGDRGNYNGLIRFLCQNDNNLYGALLHHCCSLMELDNVRIEDDREAG